MIVVDHAGVSMAEHHEQHDNLQHVCAHWVHAVAVAAQVVILACGFDTRAWRLRWPSGVCVYEVDSPMIMNQKTGALGDIQPSCQRVALVGDVGGGGAGAVNLVARHHTACACMVRPVLGAGAWACLWCWALASGS